MKDKILIIIGVLAALVATISGILLLIIGDNKVDIKINLDTSTYTINEKNESLKVYTQENFNQFLSDYNNNQLPDVYYTEFLFDGVGMYKTYDLDEFIEEGNELVLDAFDIKVLNINTLGSIELSGSLEGMVAVNTNDKKGDITIILNNVDINTKSKKVPAIYVYNKDITYTKANVTIKTLDNTINNIEGGKLKKVSLIPSDDYNTYSSYYNNDNKTNYTTYTNYYGVYTSTQIDNILFAKVKAANEDLQDGDPYYYYKASGAISSDIDINFEGTGYLKVSSKNKEGIESKGNLSFNGGTGEYYITSYDDCLNTTTDKTENTNARNKLTINVKSLYAIVSTDADEGDAIDSNGELIINGGTIVAISKTGSDSGLDSDYGTYIYGGTVISTGDMYNQINSNSTQSVLSFKDKVTKGDLITLLDSNDKAVFSLKADREFTYLVYSSSSLTNGTYSLYKNGTVEGVEQNGFYITVTSYEKGELLGYSSKGNMGFGEMPGMQGGQNNPNNQPPEKPNGEATNMQGGQNNQPPEKPNGNEMPQGGQPGQNDTNSVASNKEFVIEGISNVFSGVATYVKED